MQQKLRAEKGVVSNFGKMYWFRAASFSSGRGEGGWARSLLESLSVPARWDALRTTLLGWG